MKKFVVKKENERKVVIIIFQLDNGSWWWSFNTESTAYKISTKTLYNINMVIESLIKNMNWELIGAIKE